MNSFIYKATILFCLKASLVEARKWQDVVDKSIYLQPNLDVNRFQLKIELDPFFHPDEQQPAEAAPSPPPITWIAKTPSPTHSPSTIPSDAPSLAPTAPTSAPTQRGENVDGNGGCSEGTVLHRVNMYDSWGDGWDSATKVTIIGIQDQDTTQVTGSTVTKTHTSQQGSTTVTISTTVELTSDHPFGTSPADDGYTYVNPLGQIFEGTLNRGSRGYAYVCLVARRCYRVLAAGGDYLDEVSWDIEPIILGSQGEIAEPLVKAGAPSNCTFSIPDQNGEIFCEASCSINSSNSTLNSTHASNVIDYLTPVEELENGTYTIAFATDSAAVDRAQDVDDGSYVVSVSARSADRYQGQQLGQTFLKALHSGGS